ncbi:quinolinate synthase NadA [Lachnobacterium bovis]|uniref:quinolinate synthase NadA n=1 Tax=Lachnobacterium bovis TaxID=140626 RepID=UPI0003B6B03C|nr:quinolinate synthase NadA [Lachnobacterium bovis]
MTIKELQNKIIELKKEKDVCLLVHAYQDHEIVEVADFVGDSYGLSLKAKEAPQKNVVMCGVRFMAETVKVLSPEKRVFIANENALCPMADQMDREQVETLREQYPDYTIVAYINTTSELKTAVDVCVTSSSAVEIIKNIKNDKILFIPDCNLGSWVQKQIPEKEFVFYHGGCPTHLRITKRDVERARQMHPNAEVLVHPECLEEVTNEADYAGSTTGIMNYAKKSEKKEFIIGTENSIVDHLQYECPGKMFYPLSKECVCHNMRATTLMDVYNTIKGVGGKEIFIDDEVRQKAKNCIDKMIELGG